MTARELRRKLAKLGCTFEEGTRHVTVIYKGKTTLLNRHWSKEIKTGTYESIIKDLGIKEKR